jgi:perosamine synthetase
VAEKTLIPLSRPALGEREIGYLEDCVYSGRISSEGGFVEAFETRFAKWIGAQHAVATTSGTAALHAILAALGLRRGDEVIVPSLAYISLANAVAYTGARPIFADVDRASWTLDPAQVAERVTTRTRGILVCHLYGQPADIDPINRIAARHDLFVIESASDALGATYRDERVGTLGTAACFSFSQNRTLTTGGGGMIVTDNEELAAKARYLATQGRVSRREYLHSWIGFNYRMSNLHAALGLAQLDEIDMRLSIRRDIGLRYKELLAGIPGLSVGAQATWGVPSFGCVGVLVKDPFPCNKADLQRRLRRQGVETEPFFYPLHLQVPYAKSRGKRLPAAEELYASGLLLPSSTLLANEDLQKVAGAVRRVNADARQRPARARKASPKGQA